jgi:NAD-dependent dihydropyrimidine dehydrogenase PreA subunit
MKRKIITIDTAKCTGCGNCIPDCPEGALQLIDGKARLVSDLFCDGLGACIGTCPEGAISVIEREAAPYDEKRVMENIAPQGANVVKAHLEHLAGHGQTEYYNQAIEYLIEKGIMIPEHKLPERKEAHMPSAPDAAPDTRASSGQETRPEHPVPTPAPARECGGHGGAYASTQKFSGCPGSAARTITRKPVYAPERGVADALSADQAAAQAASPAVASELRQWPVQLSLLNPAAPYFDKADLLVSADCVPFAYAGFHQDLLQGRIVIIFCPKLDHDINLYIDKMAEILSRHTINSITIAHMEVPCCGGIRYVVEQALEKTGKKIPVTEKTISIQGDILG